MRKRKEWAESEIQLLVTIYNKAGNKKEIGLDNLSSRLNRHKTNISRKARSLGLTTYSRKLTVSQKNNISSKNKLNILLNGHPKGMLGKHHSLETRKLFSEQRKGMKKNLSPESLKKLSLRASMQMKKLLSGDKMYSRAKRGRRPDLDNIFFRSRWEANYARYLNYTNSKWKYEPKTFLFKKNKYGINSYTPDFYDIHSAEWVEVKGWLDSKSRRKLKLFSEQYPHEANKLRLVIDKLNSKGKQILMNMGYGHLIFYNSISKYFKHKIINWEGL